MQKTEAIELLGGSMTAAAEAINISFQAVSQWPDVLPPRIADRVYAALARKAGALPDIAHITATYIGPDRRKADIEAAGVDGLHLQNRRGADVKA